MPSEESKLVKVMNKEELFRLTPRDRFIANGEKARILFTDGWNIPLIIRTDAEGNAYEISPDGLNIDYNADGTLTIRGEWCRVRIFDDYHMATLKRTGVLD